MHNTGIPVVDGEVTTSTTVIEIDH